MSAGYEYDEKKGVYFRFRKDEPHMERVTEEQLFKNIIIQLVRNYPYKVTMPEGRKWIPLAAGAVTI